MNLEWRLIEALNDFRAANIDPAWWDLTDALGTTHGALAVTISNARKNILPDLGQAIACVRDGYGTARYRLTDLWVSADGSPAVRDWSANRIVFVETELRNVHQAIETAAAATDGRSKVGKKARRIKVLVGRLLEDMDHIDSEGFDGVGP